MYHGPLCLCVGVGDLFVPGASPPQGGFYGQQLPRPRRTLLRLIALQLAFFYDPLTPLRRPLVHIAALHVQCVGNLVIRSIQAHERETQHPDFQRLMRSRKNRVGQIIKACVTVGTFLALTGGFRVIKTAPEDLGGLTRWAHDAIWPAQLAERLITLHIIDQILDIDLQCWTPVMG